MALPQAVTEHYRTQQRLVTATMLLTRHEWAKMGRDFDASWEQVGPRLTLLTASAQLGAARAGLTYVPATLDQIGFSVAPEFDVDPRAFAGIASDGRPLNSLLEGAKVRAKESVARGIPSMEALGIAGKWLDMVVHTQVVDAGREAAGLTTFAHPGVGWTRMVNPPCCKDCAILAGKWFKSNTGFDRHPNCDCEHVACPEEAAPELMASPEQLFANGQVTGVTEAEMRAVADGASPISVINSRRGMSADGLYTTEGTTRRGYASYIKREMARQKGEVAKETATLTGRSRGFIKNDVVRRVRPRPTVEAIYRYSDSREEAIKLLTANGYISGDIRKVATSAL